MADVTRRRMGELLRKLFEILAAPEELKAQDTLALLASKVQLTEYEAGDHPSGGRRFETNVRFATTHTCKAGWLLKNKGLWSVTDAERVMRTSPTSTLARAGAIVTENFERMATATVSANVRRPANSRPSNQRRGSAA